MKDFNYENNVVPKHFYFYDKVIVPELFTKILKRKEPVKSYRKIDIVTLVEKSEITKKS